jgi:hypothetical protein
MANNESLGQFIDPAAWSDFDRLKKYMADAVDSMVELCNAANVTGEALKNVSALKDTIELTNKAAQANNAMTESLGKVKSGVKLLTEEQIKNNMSIKEANDYLKLKVAFDTADINTIAGKRAEIRLLTAEYNKLDLEQQKVIATQKRAELDSKNASLKGQVDAYTAQKINIGNYPDAIAQMTALKSEMDALAATGQKDSEEFTNLATKMKEVQVALGGLSGESRVVITSMEQLAAAGQQESAEFHQLAARAAELKAQMNMVGMAVEEAGAKSERGALAMEKLGESLKEIGKFAIAFFGVQAGMEFIAGITEEFGKADEAARKLKNTLENVGASNLFGELTKQAQEFAEKFNYLDTYEVQNVFSKLITYGKLTEEQINEALPVIIDFAAKTGKSLDESAGVIIKALEGSSKGLKEFGINIKEAKGALGEAMPQADRFGFIMEQLKPRVKGAADAFANSFEGGIENIKKNLREAELAIADFFVMLSGSERRAENAAIASKKEGEEAQKLVTEYETLSGKVNKTAGEKDRLISITNSLIATFGNSVVEIDKETGAIKLNLEATKDLIKQKLLLANQKASEYAMKYNSAEEDRAKNQLQLNTAALAYQAIVKQTGITEEMIVSQHRNTGGAAGMGVGGGASLTPDETAVRKMFDNMQLYKQAVTQYTDAKEDALKKLLELGFKEEDINKLFATSKLDPSKNLPAVPGGEKPDKDYIIQNEKAITDALYEQYAMQEKAKALQQKSIVDDEKETYEKRKQALVEYNRFEANANQVKILNQYEQKGFEISNMVKKPKESDDSFVERKKIANQQLINLEQEYNAQVLADKKKYVDELKSLDENYITVRLAKMKEMDGMLELNKSVELNNEKVRYEKGLIDEEVYKRNIQNIGTKYKLTELIANKAFLEDLIKQAKAAGIDTTKIQGQLDSTNAEINSLPSNQVKDDANKQKLEDQAWQAVGTAITDAKTLMDQYYEQELSYLDRKKQLIDDNYTAQINAINGSFESEQKKQQQTAVLNAQKASQDKALLQEVNRIKREQAEADKIAALLGIAENTAVSAMKVIGIPIYGEIMAALIIAEGVAQAAIVASKPLPQYGTGTEDHPGGGAIVGELGKPEWIFEPGRAPYMVNTATKLNLARHSRVIPEADLLNDSVGLLPEAMFNNFDASMMLAGMVADKMDGVRSEVANLTNAVINKKETHFSWNNGELRKSVKHGTQWNDYLDSNFN